MKINRLFLCCLLLISVASMAQDKLPFKFGKLSPNDFTQGVPAFDTGAHALVLGDVGVSRIVPNHDGGFGYEFERRIRVRILDKNGVDAGKFMIPVYFSKTNDSKEEVNSIKGITYNLDAGKIIETKLENSQIFTEKQSRNYHIKKFSMPALKEGSIFELSYRIESDFLFEFRPWLFQGDYPCLWSEYEIEVPEYYDYVYLSQGFLPYHISTSKEVPRAYRIRGGDAGTMGLKQNDFTLNSSAMQKRWVIKNIPALKEESFTTSLDNYRSKIEFQLSSIRYPNSAPIPIMEDWPKVTENLMNHQNFGDQLKKAEGYVEELLEPVLAGITDPVEKARRIYAYVRDNYTCTSRGSMYTSTGLKNLLKTKSGNVADLNLLLIAMLKSQNIESYPVILSTRSQGQTHQIYPLMDRFNYVICAALIGESEFLLDASSPDLGFGKLDIRCYNGHARVLMKDPVPIYLLADSLMERKVTMATVIVEKDSLKGGVQTDFGYYESQNWREYIREKSENAYFDQIRTSYGTDYSITRTRIDSLKKLDLPIKVYYDLAIGREEEDIMYIDPVLVPFSRENPFKSASRMYPVEMPYRIDETYLLNFEIPVGYKVDELPKSVKVSLNETDGYFEYIVNADASRIQLRTRVSLAKASFNPEDYESLREFFGYVIKKQAEQIVLKKTTTP